MADLYPVAGTKFYIGSASMPAPTDDVDADGLGPDEQDAYHHVKATIAAAVVD